MNRQIKFRAWCSNTKTMNTWGVNEDFNANDYFHILECDSGLMQFTGITDSNGVDIYEGDILSDHNGIVGFVCFPSAFLGFCLFKENHVRMDHNDSRLTVVGNMYENKGMIK